ncbi:hypothetical protein ACHAPJ_006061 [Fusarium lateritium]
MGSQDGSRPPSANGYNGDGMNGHNGFDGPDGFIDTDGTNGHDATNGSNGVNGHDTGADINGHTEYTGRGIRTERPAGHYHQDGQHNRNPRRFPRISLPVDMMRDSYDVVVIGTGYGGGVAASRMARGKQKVCVLERGKEKWPGEFPETLLEAVKELQITGEFAPGDRRSIPGHVLQGLNPTGLYHFVVGEGQNVYMANGLGGTSLVNANVFLEAADSVLNMDIWPAELKGHDNWKQYYKRAHDVLEPTKYPDTWPELPKAKLLKKQAKMMGYEEYFDKVEQTTRFEDGPNGTGVYMRASKLTGMDATGINDGSKSTTLVNYLSDAWNWGAEMFCECEVRYVSKAVGREGYIIWFAWHGNNRGRFNTLYDDLMWVHAKKLVFFGAGSIGTTEILLRSKELGLSMSDEIGCGMSGNGDMLGFGYNTDYEANCIAHPNPPKDRPVGPCITSVLDMRKVERKIDGQADPNSTKDNPLAGFVIEDCAIPLALGPLMLPMMTLLPNHRPAWNAFQRASKTAAWFGSRLFGPYFSNGSIAKTPAYLIMSHDSSQGKLTLKKNKPVLVYSGVGRSASVSKVHDFLDRMTQLAGGKFVANPAWTLLGAQEVTVHPIGGARVSSDGTHYQGAVNHECELFTGEENNGTHKGLVVCDGAAVPAAVGVNPFATITALAERSVELAAKRFGIEIDYKTKNGELDLFGVPAHPLPQKKDMRKLANTIAKAEDNGQAGINFSEVMSGYIHAGNEIKDFDVAAKIARSQCKGARFFLTVKSWDIDQLINNARHPANLTGTFVCQALGGTFIVHRGTFQLFSQDPRQPDTANLVYNFDMVSESGKKLHFNGYKVVNSTSFLNPISIWKQTSTLYVTITDPAASSKVVGRGTLNIQPWDFVQELATFQPTGPTIWSRLSSTASFLSFFTRQVSIPFLSTLGRLQWPSDAISASAKVTTPTTTQSLTAKDGERTALHMWDPLTKSEGETRTILFIPGAAVDHTMFALPTIDTNAITYFRQAGYRTYCLTHRVGRLAVAQKNYTPYDARVDIAAALERIRKENTARSEGINAKVYIIAHCAGSLALSCGLLDGTIPAEYISGITASMVFMNPKFGFVNNILSRFPISVYEKLLGNWWDCCSSPEDSYAQRLFNQALRLYPSGDSRETCRSVVCHRSQLVFGRLWTHKNLNEATHRNLDRFLGGTSMKSLSWLTSTGALEKVTNNEGWDLVTPENIARLAGIPILFLSGTGNMVFTAENTDTSFTTLCNAHGRNLYERELFTGKGHLDAWMGATSYLDVYPRVARHVGGNKVKTRHNPI